MHLTGFNFQEQGKRISPIARKQRVGLLFPSLLLAGALGFGAFTVFWVHRAHVSCWERNSLLLVNVCCLFLCRKKITKALREGIECGIQRQKCLEL